MINTAEFLSRKYNDCKLTMEQLAEVLGVEVTTVNNQISKGTLPVATFKIGRQRYATVNAVAAYLDRKAANGRREHERLRRRLGFSDTKEDTRETEADISN